MFACISLVDCPNNFAKTPLLLAAAEDKASMVEYLAGQGADVAARSRQGHNALHCACLSGETKLLYLSDIICLLIIIAN